MKRKKNNFSLTLLALLVCGIMYSQGPPPGKGPPFPCPPNNPVCGGQPGLPIDSGIPVLLLIGTLFGAYTIYNKQTIIIRKPL